MNKQLIFIFVFSLSTFTLSAQTGYQIECKNFEVNEFHGRYFNTLDVYEFYIHWVGAGEGSGRIRTWDGNFYIVKTDPFNPNGRIWIQFLEEGDQEVKVLFYGQVGVPDEVTYLAKVRDPYILGDDNINYGQTKTIRIANPPRDEVSYWWTVFEPLRLVSGQGTPEITVATNTTAVSIGQINAMIGSFYATFWGGTKYININRGVGSFNVARIGNTNIFSVYEQTEIPTIRTSAKNEYFSYELVNSLTGSITDKGRVSLDSGNLDFNHIPKGLYVLRITNEAGNSTHKINIK